MRDTAGTTAFFPALTRTHSGVLSDPMKGGCTIVVSWFALAASGGAPRPVRVEPGQPFADVVLQSVDGGRSCRSEQLS
jgi:hypothetical protein